MLGIVTSNNVKHVKEVLQILNINQEDFKVIIGNQEVKRHKPHPDPILKALEILNCDKSDVVYIGDAIDDMMCSKNAGVDSILLDRYGEYKESIEFEKIATLRSLI